MIDRYVIAITPGNTHFLIHCDDGETMALVLGDEIVGSAILMAARGDELKM